MNDEFLKWMELGYDLKEDLPCPLCGKQTIDFQYVGDPSSRIGYLDIWCKSCLHGIHVSRVLIPEGVSMMALGVDDDKIDSRIPIYTQVLPD